MMNVATTGTAISTASIIFAEKDPIASEMADEVAILDPNSGMYFGLDQVGARIWELVQRPMRVLDIRDAIVAEYDVASAQCEMDLLALLSEMSAHGLIEVRNEAHA